MSREKQQENELRAQLGGRIPSRADILKQQLSQRRFFDSGDYALSKAGKKPEPGQEIGSEHPQPEMISHRGAFLAAQSVHPVRRPSGLAKGSETVRVSATKDVKREQDTDDVTRVGEEAVSP